MSTSVFNSNKRVYYKGFSTRSYEQQGGSFGLYDVKCIQEDLMNELFTIKGERYNMPTYGTRIPLLVFEPNDPETEEVLREDVTTVIEHDPRVELLALDIIVAKDKNALVASVKVRYIEFNVVEDLYIEVGSR
jgi:phage baseplate assembly protein W